MECLLNITNNCMSDLSQTLHFPELYSLIFDLNIDLPMPNSKEKTPPISLI